VIKVSRDLDVECEAEDLSGSAALLEGQPAVDALQCGRWNGTARA